MYYISTGDSVDMPTGKVPVMKRDNISKVEIYGLECSANFTLNTIFNVFANYAYTHPKIKDYKINDPAVDANLDGKYLTDVPDHLVSGGVNFTPGFASFSILAKYTGQMWINDKNGFDDKYLFRYEYPSVFTMDAKVSKTFYNKFGLTLNIQNIFDEKYYNNKSEICPGRLITGEISYKF
jgi:outer membrane receptor protein involved in Fe transport